MRMGGNTGIERIALYALCVITLLATWPMPVMANPVVGVMARLITGLIGRRALTMEAEKVAEGVYVASLERATAQSVAATLRARVAQVAANNSMRLRGAVTWGGMAVSTGMMSLSELQSGFDSHTLQFKTDGVALGDGRYKVNLGNGIEKIVNFSPSSINPVWVYSSSTGQSTPAVSGVQTGYSVPDSAPFYAQGAGESLYYFGDNHADVAMRLAQESFPEKVQYQNATLEANGDNEGGQFSYSYRKYDFEFSHLASNPDDNIYPSGIAEYENVAGLPMAYHEVIDIGITESMLKSTFNVCQFITVTDVINGESVQQQKNYCTPPKESDYVLKQTREQESYLVWTNTKYAPAIQYKAGAFDEVVDKLNMLEGRKVDSQLLAKIVNALLMEAASKSDYQGLPFSSSDLFTASDVDNVLREQGLSLTQKELFSPVDVNVNINTSTNTQVDVQHHNEDESDSDHPDIGEPSLDNPPDGKQILAPLLNLFPFIKNLTLPVRAAQCPVAEFEAFEKHYVIDSHCDLLEKNRALFALMAGVVWAFLSLRIMLSA